VTTQLTVAAVLLVALRLRRFDRATTLPLGRAPAWSFAGALLVVFGLAPLAQVVGELTSRLLGVDLKASLIVSHMAQSSTAGEVALLLVCLSVLPGLIEEAMFRGYITSAYGRRSFAAQLIVPSVLFGLFHLEPTQSMATIVLGVGFALARLYTGSLVPSMVAHAVYNATVLSVARSMPEAEDHVIRLTPVAVGAALFAAGFVILRASRAERAAASDEEHSAPEPR
jgi:membrane protease YdiL (CAAX protease family)